MQSSVWFARRACKSVRARAALALSEDHKPNRTDERSRIEAAGGVVVWAGTWRVGGVLAVSRAFGDRLLKRCEPGRAALHVHSHSARGARAACWPCRARFVNVCLRGALRHTPLALCAPFRCWWYAHQDIAWNSSSLRP